MSRHPNGTKRDHEKFCRIENWDRVHDATGRPVGHHLTFELVLPDDRILRTRISHPVDNTAYGARLWAHILKQQLEVTPDQFWSCVRDGHTPDRGQSRVESSAQRLPLYLVTELVEHAGLDEAAVLAMDIDEATAALAVYWKRRAQGPSS